MKIGCSEVPKPTYPSLLWLAEWKVPAPLKWWLVSETPMPSLHYRAVLSRYWYFCLRHSWDSWGCDQNYNQIQGQKIAWHHHELLNKTSCQSWAIMLIMVIIMDCWIKPLVNHGRLQDRSKEEELFFLVVHSLRWLSLSGNLLNGVSMTHEY